VMTIIIQKRKGVIYLFVWVKRQSYITNFKLTSKWLTYEYETIILKVTLQP